MYTNNYYINNLNSILKNDKNLILVCYPDINNFNILKKFELINIFMFKNLKNYKFLNIKFKLNFKCLHYFVVINILFDFKILNNLNLLILFVYFKNCIYILNSIQINNIFIFYLNSFYNFISLINLYDHKFN